jgi:hypothetical protein
MRLDFFQQQNSPFQPIDEDLKTVHHNLQKGQCVRLFYMLEFRFTQSIDNFFYKRILYKSAVF